MLDENSSSDRTLDASIIQDRDPECERYPKFDENAVCNDLPYTSPNVIEKNFECRLTNKYKNPLIPVAFPSCADLLLSQASKSDGPRDEIKQFFCDYFRYKRHVIFDDPTLVQGVSPDLIECALKHIPGKSSDVHANDFYRPSPYCLPISCVSLEGTRNLPPDTIRRIKRLYLGDLIWLFYMERMGIFKMIGAILDDFAFGGKYPISDNSLTAIILEAMIRLTKTGSSSTVRDRDSTYRRCLGWTSDVGRKLDSTSEVNVGFDTLFHKFIRSALDYYKDKRLASAIQSTTTAKPSVATLIEIGNTLVPLKNAFISFYYGRNYYNTLNGIVWAVAGFDLIKRLKTGLGIPDTFKEPHLFITAAYDLLVLKRPITPADVNRYTLHRECANDGRDILLDIEVLDTDNPRFASPGNELEIWLDRVEDRIEGYRTDYRSLTGVDLGSDTHKPLPKLEQQV